MNQYYNAKEPDGSDTNLGTERQILAVNGAPDVAIPSGSGE